VVSQKYPVLQGASNDKSGSKVLDGMFYSTILANQYRLVMKSHVRELIEYLVGKSARTPIAFKVPNTSLNSQTEYTNLAIYELSYNHTLLSPSLVS
jgi:hypothetical protein